MVPRPEDEPIGEDPPDGGDDDLRGEPGKKESESGKTSWGTEGEVGKGTGTDGKGPGGAGIPAPGGGGCDGGGCDGGDGGDDVVVPELYYGFTGPVSMAYASVVPSHRHYVTVGEDEGRGTGVASADDILSDTSIARHSHPVNDWEVGWWVHEGDEEIAMHTHEAAFLDDESQWRWDAFGSTAEGYKPPTDQDPDWLARHEETKDLADFGDFCAVPTETEPDLSECPGCVPNPRAAVPNWTAREQDNPFLNEQTCEYWVTVKTTSGDMNNLISDTAAAKQTAVKSLLRAEGKDDADDVIGGVILAGVETPKNYLNTRTGTFLKILVTVPYDTLQQARPAGTGPTDDAGDVKLTWTDAPPEVTLYSNDLDRMPQVIKKAFHMYEVQKEVAEKQKELPFTNININTEGNYILEFKRKLKSFLSSNGYKTKSTRNVPLMEAVTITFSDDFTGVTKVVANLFGCDGEEFGGPAGKGKKWDKFVNSTAATTQTTLYFYSQLTEIFNDVTARKPITVDKLLRTYWYPAIDILKNFEPGQKLELLNDVDTSKKCNWKNFKITAPLDALGNEVLAQLLTFPELFAAALVKNTCYTIEGRAVEDEKYKILEDIEKRWKDAKKREEDAGDGIFAQCLAEEDDPKDPSGDDKVEAQTLSELYKLCLDKLGWCGLLALLQEAIKCIMEGLDLNTNLRTLLKAFIENATSSEIQGLFFKLNPALQNIIKTIALETAGTPLPWEVGYQAGSYSGQSLVNTQFSTKDGTDRQADMLWGPVENQEDLQNRINKQDEFLKELEEEGTLEHTKFNKDGTLRSMQTTKSPGLGADRYGGGTVGKLADTIADEAFKAVKDAFIKAITEEIISPEALMEALNDIPGAAIIMKSLSSSNPDCPPPKLFTPPLDDFLKTAEFDICQNHYALTLPVWNKISVKTLMGQIKTVIIESAEDALEKLVMKIIMLILSKLMNFLLNAPCDILAEAAAVLKDVAGGSSLMDALANQLCDEADEDDLTNALNDLFDQWNVWDPNCDTEGTEEAISHFMNGVSSILTNEEAYSLLQGNPSPAVLSYVMDVVGASPFDSIKCAFPNPNSVKGAFGTIAQMVSLPDVKDLLSDDVMRSPMSPNICSTDEALKTFKDAREAAYKNKGVVNPELQEQLDLLNDLAKQDLADLANAAQGGIFGSLPDFMSDDPNCPENGLVPYVDEGTLQAGEEVTKGVYDNLTLIFQKELTTRRGLLNMILSDTRGAGLKRHHEWYINTFGERTSQDIKDKNGFTWFNWYVDEDDADGGEGNVFPEQVAPYLRKILDGSAASNALSFDFDITSFRDFEDNLILSWQNWGEEEPESLSLSYNQYIVSTGGNTIGDNLFSLQLTSENKDVIPTFNLIAPRTIDGDVQEYINSNLPYALTYNNLYEAIAADAVPEADPPSWLADLTLFSLKKEVDGNVKYDPEGIDSSNIQSSIPSHIFATLAQEKWIQSEDLQTYFSEDMFNYVTNAILHKFALKISDNGSAWKFGYDASIGPRVHFLDKSEDFEKYGGTPDNPHFWIEPPKYGGWLGIYDKLVPEVDACESKSLVDFGEIGSVVDEYNRKFKNDERLQANPACIREPAYARILTGAAAAGIEGAIRATVRLYIVEAFLKGIPVFSLFEVQYPGTFDETLFSYLAMKLRDGLIETGKSVWGRIDLTKETYYYIFLEQVVQSFDRKVKLGEIIPTSAEQVALDRIFQLQTLWVEPGVCFNLRNIPWPARRAATKKCREQKRSQFVEYLRFSQNEALIILNRYIAEELETVAKIFKKSLKPNVKNFPSLLFGSPLWMKGGSAVSEGGPLDVAKDILSTTGDLTVSSILGSPQGTSLSSAKANKEDEYFPFVLEKYIKIKDYSEAIMIPSGSSGLKNNILSRDDNKKDVVNMDLWREYVENEDWEGLKIKDLFKEWSFGIRISFKMPNNSTVTNMVDPNAFTDQECRLKESYKMYDEDTGTPVYIFPLIESEINISKNQLITPDILEQFDLNCLVGEMIESTEYKTVFNYCFPLPGLLSLITIYIMETFLLSIGEEWGKDYEENKGRQGGANWSQFKRWDPQENFKRTKRILRKTFQSYYYSSDSGYKDPDEKTDEQKGREKLNIKKKFPSDKDIKRWQRRMQIPKPVETCEGD